MQTLCMILSLSGVFSLWTASANAAEEKKGDVWETDGADRVLILNEDNFDESLKDKKIAVVMFYAPWCGHCKRAKPDFALAAKEVKEGHALAAVDCTQAADLCKKNEVRGYPTLKVFENGALKGPYTGGRTKTEFLAAANGDPPPKKEKPEHKKDEWDTDGGDLVVKLMAKDFDAKLKDAANALVMFYAPWCGHCKRAKPLFALAAKDLKDGNVIAAMDCTDPDNTAFCREKEVRGYPTIQIFKNGAFVEKYTGARTQAAFAAVANGQAPPPAPPAKPPTDAKPDVWDTEGGDAVAKLGADDFDKVIGQTKAALIMFYAPWCGHCKRAKPLFALAAKDAPETTKLAAVDCTQHKEFCKKHEVRGYPTIQVFRNGKFAEKYSGQRTTEDFLKAVEISGKDEL